MSLKRNQKVAIVQEFLIALRESNTSVLKSIMTKDVVWIIPQSSPPPFAGRHQGADKIIDMLKLSLFKPNSGGVEVGEMIIEGDRIVAEVTISGDTIKNRHYKNFYVFIITLRDNKVMEFKEHLDTAYANAVFWAED